MNIPTAILLVDVQNEFLAPGGLLYDRVKDVIEKTGMMMKLPSFVKEARNNGATIIYSPVCGKQVDNHAYANVEGVFKEGSWNAQIVNELKPQDNDVILTDRSDFSAFQGTDLSAILKVKRIKRVFIAGLLTNVCIWETVREAFDLGFMEQGLEVLVMKDCCAAEKFEEHVYTLDFGMMNLCKTITYRQALESILNFQQREVFRNSMLSTSSRSMRGSLRSSRSSKSMLLVGESGVVHEVEDSEASDTYDSELYDSTRRITYEPKVIRDTTQILRFTAKWDFVLWSDYCKYIILTLILQFTVGQDYVFPDGRPGCQESSYVFGGPNHSICHVSEVLQENYYAMRVLVAFILGGFITHTVFLWRTRRTNYCQLCGASRNLILQISSLIPAPTDQDEDRYEEIKRERDTMERWAILGFELAVLKGKGKIDTMQGRANLEALGLLAADEWDKMVAGDRHTTVWYWIQQKAVYLTEQGIISSELRLQTLCEAVTQMRDKANDLMSVIDRDNPHAYSFVVGILVNLNLIALSVHKGVIWAIWLYDSKGTIYKTPAMYVDFVLTLATIVTFTMLYDIAFVLYNPFNERAKTDDIPHRIVASGIRNLADRLGEAKDTRPSTMFWMESQTEERERLGLRYKPTRIKKARRRKIPSLDDSIRFTERTSQCGPNSLKSLNVAVHHA